MLSQTIIRFGHRRLAGVVRRAGMTLNVVGYWTWVLGGDRLAPLAGALNRLSAKLRILAYEIDRKSGRV